MSRTLPAAGAGSPLMARPGSGGGGAGSRPRSRGAAARFCQTRVVDIAVNLVENYLRLNGYLTLSEFEVQRRERDGTFTTVTDVDIMAMRLPGEIYAGDPHDETKGRLLLINDPVLELRDDLIDVIIGEVKQGEAEFNEGIRNHAVLHSMLQRVEWLYDEPIGEVIDALRQRSLRLGPARGGGEARTRLVAFGRSSTTDLHVISLTHIVETMIGFFEEMADAFRPVQFRDPAPAMLALLRKTGFGITKIEAPPPGGGSD